MNKIYIFVVASFLSMSLIAQSSSEAQKLLNEVTTKTKAYTNQRINFKSTINSPTGNPEKPRSSRSMSGEIFIKGDSYRLLMGELVYIFDGTKMYIVDPEIEEVDVTTLEDGMNLTPNSILDEFDKNYSFKMGKKHTVDGMSIQDVHLKPNGASELEEVIVSIDTKGNKLYSYKMFGTNDVITEISISEYEVNIDIPSSTFSFNKSEWEGYEVNN